MYEHADGTKSLKLGDFGLATVVDGPLYTVCGTPTYVAPEIIAETGLGYSKLERRKSICIFSFFYLQYFPIFAFGVGMALKLTSGQLESSPTSCCVVSRLFEGKLAKPLLSLFFRFDFAEGNSDWQLE